MNKNCVTLNRSTTTSGSQVVAGLSLLHLTACLTDSLMSGRQNG